MISADELKTLISKVKYLIQKNREFKDAAFDHMSSIWIKLMIKHLPPILHSHSQSCYLGIWSYVYFVLWIVIWYSRLEVKWQMQRQKLWSMQLTRMETRCQNRTRVQKWCSNNDIFYSGYWFWRVCSALAGSSWRWWGELNYFQLFLKISKYFSFLVIDWTDQRVVFY